MEGLLLAILILPRSPQGPEEEALRACWVPPAHLDPHRVTALHEARLAGALFEGLTTHGADGVTVAPGMAERWEESPDGLRWTFRLREARWSNGDALTALDFAASWRRALDPSTGCVFRDLFRVFRNVGRHLEALREEGRSEVDEREFGFEAADVRTLRVTLERRVPWLPDLLAFPCFAPLHGRTVLEQGEDWVRPGRIVTNGPYLLESAGTSGIRLRRNPGYWEEIPGAPGEVRIEFLTGEEALRRFEAGRLDWVEGGRIPPGRIGAGAPGLAAHPAWGVRFLRFNVRKPPFDRKGMRLAVARAVDRRLLGGEGRPAERLVPPGVPGYAGGKPLAGDPSAAMEALLEATGADLSKFPGIELLTTDAPDAVDLGRRLRARLERVLGVVVQISPMKPPAYRRAMARGEFQAALEEVAGEGFDPAAFLEDWGTGHPRNAGGWACPEYDALLAASLRERDPIRRLSILAEAESLLLSEGAAVPLLWPELRDLVGPRVGGFHPNPMGRCSFKHLRVLSR